MRTLAYHLMERSWDRIAIATVPIVSTILVAIGWILFFVTLVIAPFVRFPLKLLRGAVWVGEPIIRGIIATM